MKLTIIVDDSMVYIDLVSHEVKLSTANIPTGTHALQWNGTTGWIEFSDLADGSKPANEQITALPEWANACVSLWNSWVAPVPIVSPPMATMTPAPAPNQPTATGTQTI